MGNAQPKTRKTNESVDKFLDAIPDEGQRADCKAIRDIMQTVSQDPGAMWGPAIVGFSSYHYVYASGREGDWLKIGFSPRKGKTTLYLTYGLDQHRDLLDKLGKFTTGKACLYIKHLGDVDQDVLRDLVTRCYQEHPSTGSRDEP